MAAMNLRRLRRRLRGRPARLVIYAVPGVVLLVVIGWEVAHRPARPAPTTPIAIAPSPATVTVPTVSPALDPGGAITLRWPRGRPLRVLFVGDSITQGRIATSPANDYVSRVTTALEHHGSVTPTVNWKSGSPVEYWMRQPFPTDLDLAIVEVGTNEKSVPEPKFAADYLALVAKIHKASPRAKMVCLSMWRPDQTIGAFAELNKDILYGCDGAFADLTEAAHEPANISPVDKFHPNDAGHAAIARAVLELIHVR